MVAHTNSNSPTSLAIRSDDQPLVPETLNQVRRLADELAPSELLPPALRGKPANVVLVLMKGRELGLSPLQAIGGLHVIDGKVSMSADIMVGLVKRHAACKYFRCVESTTKHAVYETIRDGAPEPERLTYAIEDARTAGLLSKQNWQKHPAAMLRARCSAALARMVYPDVCAGIYDPDEVDEFRRPQTVAQVVQVHQDAKRAEPTSALESRVEREPDAPPPVGPSDSAEEVHGEVVGAANNAPPPSQPVQEGPTEKQVADDCVRLLTSAEEGKDVWPIRKEMNSRYAKLPKSDPRTVRFEKAWQEALATSREKKKAG